MVDRATRLKYRDLLTVYEICCRVNPELSPRHSVGLTQSPGGTAGRDMESKVHLFRKVRSLSLIHRVVKALLKVYRRLECNTGLYRLSAFVAT